MERYEKKFTERIAKKPKDHKYNVLVLYWIEDIYPEYFDKSIISKRMNDLFNKNLISNSTLAEVIVADFMESYGMSERSIPPYLELLRRSQIRGVRY